MTQTRILSMFRFFLATMLVFVGSVTRAQDLPIFDAHMHYSHDAVLQIPPEQVVEILRKAVIRKVG